MSSTVTFPRDRSSGRLFWVERAYSIDEDMVEWLGEARGDVELPAGGYAGIILPEDTDRRQDVLAALDTRCIQLVYFSNPFQLPRALASDDELFLSLPGDPSVAPSDEDCVLLRELSGLKALSIGKSRVSDAGLSWICELVSLESLNLCSTRITDSGLRFIAALPCLKELDLSFNAITDQGTRHLSNLAELEELSLADTAVSDRSIEHLNSLTGLRLLDISDTAISAEGKGELRRTLPDCLVWPA